MSELLNGTEWFTPSPLHKDGDLIDYIQCILDERGRSTVRLLRSKAMRLMRWLLMVWSGGNTERMKLRIGLADLGRR